MRLIWCGQFDKWQSRLVCGNALRQSSPHVAMILTQGVNFAKGPVEMYGIDNEYVYKGVTRKRHDNYKRMPSRPFTISSTTQNTRFPLAKIRQAPTADEGDPSPKPDDHCDPFLR